MKYMIKARLEVNGRVDKHDVIGAIFGQTEGLLGSEFNLEELQDKGKIGRVIVDLKHQGTKTIGTIQIPSNLDRVETSILAAMIETVDKIGPYHAKITVEEIKDLREEKLKRIIERARELLKMMKSTEPDVKEIIREVTQTVEAKRPQVIEYGPEKLPAGPDVDKSDTIIVVEGRADVINLLKYGYTNVIAIEGAREKIPKTIVDLSKKKKVIAFVDGDHGGDLVLRSLLTQAKVDLVARAPKGMEVEELTGREIAEALNSAEPAEEVAKRLGLAGETVKEEKAKAVVEAEKARKPEARAPAAPAQAQAQAAGAQAAQRPARQPVSIEMAIPKAVVDEIAKLKGTLEGILYDSEWREIERVKVRDLFNRLQEIEPGKVHAVVFDGIITQRLLDLAAEKKIPLIIGAKVGSKLAGRPSTVHFMTFDDLAP
ncbi:DNA primase DnaG [Stetteria hydrogenophila]